jgi:hypothetical protein
MASSFGANTAAILLREIAAREQEGLRVAVGCIYTDLAFYYKGKRSYSSSCFSRQPRSTTVPVTSRSWLVTLLLELGNNLPSPLVLTICASNILNLPIKCRLHVSGDLWRSFITLWHVFEFST